MKRCANLDLITIFVSMILPTNKCLLKVTLKDDSCHVNKLKHCLYITELKTDEDLKMA